MRVVAALAFLVVLASACGQSRGRASMRECTSDLDCSEGERCQPASDPARRAAANIGPCLPSSGCACGPGQVCRTSQTAGCPAVSMCVNDCDDPGAIPCGDGFVCRASGACEALRCDDLEHPGCPTGMACDPMASVQSYPFGRYSLFGTDQYPTTDFDHGPMLSERQTAAVATGCVFLRCDESGAFDCAENFRCDVESAPADGSGCVGIPCDELGACFSDTFICEPTSTGPRPALVDAHGCVSKNCEEGYECPASSECDFTRPGDSSGCAFIRCDEPNGSCPRENTKCDPSPARLPSGLTPTPDQNGCVLRHCEIDGAPCPDGTLCAPEDPRGSITGCAEPPPPPDAGAGGTGAVDAGTSPGGMAGTAGAGIAGAASGDGGRSTTPGMPGVCR